MLEVDDVLEILGIKLIGIVPEDEKIMISTNLGSPASLDDDNRAGEAFRAIARRIRGEDVPYPLLAEDKGGLFGGLRRLLGGTR